MVRLRAQTSFVCGSLIATTLSLSGASAQSTARPRPEVPYVPTTEEAVEAMLKMADVKKTDIVYDLGCGDGRIVIAAAKNFGARGVGIDIDPVRIAEAKENAKKAGVENLVRFEENDLFKADIHEATVVTLFLLSSVNLRLRPKLQQDLKPGTRIVSNTFDMGDWKPDKDATVGNPDEQSYLSHRLYLWVLKSGTIKGALWQSPAPLGAVVLRTTGDPKLITKPALDTPLLAGAFGTLALLLASVVSTG